MLTYSGHEHYSSSVEHRDVDITVLFNICGHISAWTRLYICRIADSVSLPFCKKPCNFLVLSTQIIVLYVQIQDRKPGRWCAGVKTKGLSVGLGFPRWIPSNFGRAGKKANRAGTHCKRLYGSRARKRCTVDGAPPLSQHHKAVTVRLTLQMGSK